MNTHPVAFPRRTLRIKEVAVPGVVDDLPVGACLTAIVRLPTPGAYAAS